MFLLNMWFFFGYFIFGTGDIALLVRDISQIYRQSFIFFSSSSSILLFLRWLRNLSQLRIEIMFLCLPQMVLCMLTHSLAISDYYYHYLYRNHWLFHNYKPEWECAHRLRLLKTLIFCLVCSLFFCPVHIINSVSWTIANFFFCFLFFGCASSHSHNLLAIDRHSVNFSSVILFWSTDMV